MAKLVAPGRKLTLDGSERCGSLQLSLKKVKRVS